MGVLRHSPADGTLAVTGSLSRMKMAIPLVLFSSDASSRREAPNRTKMLSQGSGGAPSEKNSQ
jgi:hypothetical protein